VYSLESYVDHDNSVEQLPPDDEAAFLTASMTASAHNDYVSYHGVTSQTRQLIANAISYLTGLLNRDDDRSRNSAIHMIGVFEFLRLYKAQQESSGISPATSQTRYKMLKFKIERTAFCLHYITGRSRPWFSEPPSWNSLDSDARCPAEKCSQGHQS
jgi:hypothetical protein